MKARLFTAIATTIVLVCGWTLTGLCSEFGHLKLSLIYADFLEAAIERSDARAKWLDADCPILRMAAIQASAKGAFLKANRRRLIKYLLVKIVSLNRHAVEHYLDQIFVESLLPTENYTAFLNATHGE